MENFNLTNEAQELLKGICRRKNTTCRGLFRASALTASACCGYKKIGELLKPLKELITKGFINEVEVKGGKNMYEIGEKSKSLDSVV